MVPLRAIFSTIGCLWFFYIVSGILMTVDSARNQTTQNQVTKNHVSAREYKRAMRHLAGAVSVITVEHEGERGGLTATSVASVAADPAELLVCINQSTATWPLLERSGRFAVNILAADQQDVAKRFAGIGQLQGDARYGEENWIKTDTGVWILKSAAAALACTVDEVILRHSHALVFGRVREVFYQTAETTRPLVYWQGSFANLALGK